MKSAVYWWTSNTRLLLVNSPHNPTGSVIAAMPISKARTISCVPQRGVQFVCDQVYHPIYYGKVRNAQLPQARCASCRKPPCWEISRKRSA